jgi:hypothetical protein
MQHPAHKIYIYFAFTSHCVQCLYCREINNLTHDQHGYIRNQHKKCTTVNLREAEHCTVDKADAMSKLHTNTALNVSNLNMIYQLETQFSI